MNRLTLKSRIGTNGVLQLEVPMGLAEADREVQVTIEPAAPSAVSREEWLRFIESTAGKWEGEFERPDQGVYEVRDPLS
jgi:hypothetical protein